MAYKARISSVLFGGLCFPTAYCNPPVSIESTTYRPPAFSDGALGGVGHRGAWRLSCGPAAPGLNIIVGLPLPTPFGYGYTPNPYFAPGSFTWVYRRWDNVAGPLRVLDLTFSFYDAGTGQLLGVPPIQMNMTYDSRTPEEIAGAPKFVSDVQIVVTLNGRHIVMGETNLTDGELEYFDGTAWQSLQFYGRSPFSLDYPGRFFGVIPADGSGTPVIRVRPTSGPETQFGYSGVNRPTITEGVRRTIMNRPDRPVRPLFAPSQPTGIMGTRG